MTHLELITKANTRIMESDALSCYEEILLDPVLYREGSEQSKQYLRWLIEASEQSLIDYAEMEMNPIFEPWQHMIEEHDDYYSDGIEEYEERERDWDRWQDDYGYDTEECEGWE